MPIIVAMSEENNNDIGVLDNDILLVLHFLQEVGMTQFPTELWHMKI